MMIMDAINIIAPKMIDAPVPVKFTGFRLSQNSTVAVGHFLLVGKAKFPSGSERLVHWQIGIPLEAEGIASMPKDAVFAEVQARLGAGLKTLREGLLEPVAKGFFPHMTNPIWWKKGESQRMRGRPVVGIEWYRWADAARLQVWQTPEYTIHRQTKSYYRRLYED